MNVKIFMSAKEAQKEKESVIYNYIASHIKATPEKMRTDLKEKFGLKLTEKEIKKMISEYVRKQTLSPKLRYYIRKGIG